MRIDFKDKSTIKFLVLIVLVIGIPGIFILRNPEILNIFRSIDGAKDFLDDYKEYSYVVYVILQVIQVVVTILPQQFTQLAGGYFFGPVITIVLSVLGMLIGTFISYYLSKLLGKEFIYKSIGKEQFEKYQSVFTGKRANIATALVYVIPGLPKDLFAYIAGIAGMRLIPFLIISTICRLPGVLISIFAGKFISEKSWVMLIIVLCIGAIFVGVLFFNRKKLLDKLFNKKK